MAVELFVEIGGKVLGPLTAAQVRGLAHTGKLKPDDRIRKGREGAWSSAGKVPGLFDAQSALPGSAIVPREVERPAELVPVRTTPAQIVSAVYGSQVQEVGSITPPPPPRPSRTDLLARALEQPMAPPLPTAPPVQPATVFPQQAPAYYQPQPLPQAQAYFPPQPLPQGQPYPGYGYPQPQPPAVIINNVVNAPSQPYIVRPRKSAAIAALLAFLFGPLGMLYSTVPGALTLFAVNLILVIPTFGLIFIITWPAGIVWAAIAANNTG